VPSGEVVARLSDAWKELEERGKVKEAEAKEGAGDSI
jgi:hypothetical protein